jgi:replicative DNA helicase
MSPLNFFIIENYSSLIHLLKVNWIPIKLAIIDYIKSIIIGKKKNNRDVKINEIFFDLFVVC